MSYHRGKDAARCQDPLNGNPMLMIQKFTKFAALSAVSFLLLTPAHAQVKEDKTVAIVNGHEIKVSEVEMAAEDILGQLPDIPPKLRYPYIVEYLVERHLLAQAAVKEGIADSDEYKRRLALYQAKALRDAYFAQTIVPTVTEDEMKKAYDTESAKVAQTERVRARHILVATEQEAKQIRARLQKGEKFEDLAKQYSTDGSKEYGGDLGYFTAPEMVPEFSKAAFALKPGEVSPPVKTDFGWHIIKLEDRKMGGAQPYDQVKTAIRNILLRKKTQEKIIKLRMESKVELKDPDLAKFAEEARKLRQKALQQKQGGAAPAGGDQPDATDAPALTGDEPTTGGGKSDMQAPQ
jgi:peptidyl-prolyl cis-trans isomerase C